MRANRGEVPSSCVQSADRCRNQGLSEDADCPPSQSDSSSGDDLINPDSILDTPTFFTQLASEDGVDAEILRDRIRVCAACEKAFLVHHFYSHDCKAYFPGQEMFKPPFPPEKIYYNNWKYYAKVWHL